MKSSEIRTGFLKFFETRGHRAVPSSSLVPANDPTLLFANAGMNQFKDVFLGRERRDYSRACSSQKCVRAGGKHNDLEQVGRTRRHHTFFEMLGNFSFGDYFKKEAIPWAWELITQGYGILPAKLYATVFREDDEAEELWAKIVPRERIFRMDEKDNFWAMGETGPCGPCSELHYDMGSEASDLGHTDCKFPCDCGRYVELWNLVFMQFNRDEQGNMTPLPRPSIDTGAGLERLTAVLQGKVSNFDTDLFQPLIEEASNLANVEYGANHDTDVSLRIIADHARASTFLISDGVLPSNEGRGYVLRLIMRRALYHGQTLGLNEPFLFKMAAHVVQMIKDAYPELLETEQHVAKAIKIEEERYAQTTRRGLEEMNSAIVYFPSGLHAPFRAVKESYPGASSELKKVLNTREPLETLGPNLSPSAHALGTGMAQYKVGQLGKESRNPLDAQLVAALKDAWLSPGPGFEGLPRINGADLFRLHDTFGLRPEFVRDVVVSYGLDVDMDGYNAEMERQRERARASWKGAERKVAPPIFLHLAEEGETAFEGYTKTTSSDCRILGLVRKGETIREAKPGNAIEVILDHTPFYAEAGGQVGDTGFFFTPGSDHELAHVTDTYRPVSGLIVHKAIARDTLRVGDLVTAKADTERRDAIRRNHTATHLLHAALRTTLGTHVKQAGSLVAPDRLRFDFSHFAGLDEQDLLDIEDLVNEHVLKNEEVVTNVMDLDSAVNSGAMALFGEKYGDKVRVVSIADGSFSKELCGGTHVRRTGDIGLFKIASESSVAAGTRRIEALTGTGVLHQLRQASETLALLSNTLRAKPDELLQAAEKLTEAEKKLRKELEAQQMKRAASQAGRLVEQARDVKGVRVIAAQVEVTDRSAMRQMVDDLRAKLQSGVIVLGSVADGKVSLIAAVTQDLTNKLDAGKIVKQAAAFVEGSGGGRKDLAEAGGKNPAKLGESLQAIPTIIEKML
ncbi:MAG: alanine--tRNA ligase [Acidobacteriia bacterium]|nr:alanine--tRNA ligase [Terriglobia bacterium]